MRETKTVSRKMLEEQLIKVKREEIKFALRSETKMFENQTAPIKRKIESKIPAKLQETLEKAFEAGFKIVFEKGTGIVEKTYDKAARQEDFRKEHQGDARKPKATVVSELDKNAATAAMGNELLTTLEGSALGALGIGLPDIPVFIGMMMKSVYEISLSYGFSYEADREKLYILYLIGMGITTKEKKRSYEKKLERVAEESFTRGDIAPVLAQAIQISKLPSFSPRLWTSG